MSTYFGLDFGSSSLKVGKVSRMGEEFVVENLGLGANPVGSIDFESRANRQKLLDSLRQVIKEAGIRDKRVVAGVPEAHVYSQVVEMPIMPERELESAVQWEAEQFIPIPVEEVELDYTVVKRPPKGSVEEKMLVYVVASRKKYLNAWVDFLIEAGLEPIALENETVALSRVFGSLGGVSLVLHLGALNTSISILSQGKLMFSHSVPTGGAAITRALAQSLSLQVAQAEQYKRTYGLNGNEFEGKVREAILVVLKGLVDEVRKASEFFENKYQERIERIVVSGGGAYMPELISYLTEKFAGLEAVIANPFVKAKGKGKKVGGLPQEGAVYSVAVGLALRSF